MDTSKFRFPLSLRVGKNIYTGIYVGSFWKNPLVRKETSLLKAKCPGGPTFFAPGGVDNLLWGMFSLQKNCIHIVSFFYSTRSFVFIFETFQIFKSVFWQLPCYKHMICTRSIVVTKKKKEIQQSQKWLPIQNRQKGCCLFLFVILFFHFTLFFQSFIIITE